MIAFQVSDMTSSRCAGAVTKALKAVDHAALVRVDLATFTVEIEPSSANARQLSDAIKRAGLLAGGGMIPPGRPKGEYRSAEHEGAPESPITTFAVSKVGLDAAGRVTAVLWGRVDTSKNVWATPERVVPVAEAVAALDAGAHVFALFPSIHGHLPDREFVAADYDDGRKTIVLKGPTAYEREIHDMDRLDPQRKP